MITGENPVPMGHPSFEMMERWLESGEKIPVMYEGLLSEPYKTTMRLTGAVEVFSEGEVVGKIYYHEIDDSELEKLLTASKAFRRPH